MKSFNKVLVANRGEIAVRIIKTLTKMNIRSVAVHSLADSNALFVKMADESILLSGDSLSETYLNADLIIKIALETRSEAIHPGYGFLSENADFALKVSDSGLIFIGPSPEAISLMGDKLQARILARKLNVPLIEGIEGKYEEIIDKAKDLKYPLLVKAAAGGGGKAMHIVYDSKDLKKSLEIAASEALRYFGNNLLYVEQFFGNARHIEVQVLVDQFGTIFIPGDRECSVQRRYQKVIEEAPSASLKDSVRKDLFALSEKICQSISYRSAGTLEFLLDDQDRYYFLEMNTRIQVEHPVTELTTGIDIVEMQVNIAAGNPLDVSKESKPIGHAIEARIYAENPEKEFLPSSGNIYSYAEPENENLRIDSGIDGPIVVFPDYDPLIAKISASGTDRKKAIKNLLLGINAYHIAGFPNNKEFLSEILQNEEYIQNKISTSWLEKSRASLVNSLKVRKENIPVELILSFWLTAILTKNDTLSINAWYSDRFRRNNLSYSLKIDHEVHDIEVESYNKEEIKFILKNGLYEIKKLKINGNKHSILMNGKLQEAFVSCGKSEEDIISINGMEFRIKPANYIPSEPYILSGGNDMISGTLVLKSPLHGKIVKLNVSREDRVKKGDLLISLEAMKMENRILAPADGFVHEVMVSVGSQVAVNQSLITIKDKL
jgi:acetyl/propionyl-CoA carboxylase alpha subunit